jgi:hypothetical protein
VVCVCGTGRTTPTLVGGRTAAGRCKTGPRPLPQAALNETSSISVIFIYLYCEIHIFNYSSICLRTTPFELLQNHLTRVQRVKRDPTIIIILPYIISLFHEFPSMADVLSRSTGFFVFRLLAALCPLISVVGVLFYSFPAFWFRKFLL